jgi:DNA polymerase (family 10)
MAKPPKKPPAPAHDPATLTKNDVARILDDVSVMLEITGANPFRSRAFYNAARALEELTADLRELVESKELLEVRGIGKSIFGDIQSLFATGSFALYDELRGQVPAGVLEMLRVSGIGPKKVKLIYDTLGVDSVEALERAGREGKLAVLPGFGEKTQLNVLRAIARMRTYEDRFLYSDAFADASEIYDAVRAVPGVRHHLLGGSLRRRRETIGDVDILVTADESERVMEAFTTLPRVATVVSKGTTRSSVILDTGIHVDLRVVKDEEFAFASHYFTGSKAHNTEVRARAKKLGYKLNEYGLFDADDRPTPCKDEPALFAVLGMDYIPPELREHTGEIEAAAAHALPRLLEERDVRGVFHCHTTYSDGHATLREMAEAARALGHQYIGIADHSRTAVYASGLSIEKVERQREEIARLNEALAPFTIFHGIESDILPDGSLDYPDEVLARFDYVVASIHGQFGLTETQMTKRIVRAMENPFTTMLGHPTGRVLLAREGYPVNIQALIDAAAANDGLIEINAYPNRLDLDWRYVKSAKEDGVMLAINPDAHHTEHIAFFRYGVGVARKGWLEKKDVLNSRTAAQVGKFFGARKKRKGIA